MGRFNRRVRSFAVGLVGTAFGFAGGNCQEVARLFNPCSGAGDVFTYSGFGDSSLREFSSVQWVQCGYSPQYTDPDDPNAAGLAVGARDNALEGSWSCAEQPPPLWGTP